MTIDILLEDGDTEITVDFPSHRVVCPTCNGYGKTDHPAFSDGFTSSEWANEDEDFKRDYMAGAYNVTCPECRGNNVVEEVDENSLNDDQRAMYEIHLKNLQYEYDCRAEMESERRMGC